MKILVKSANSPFFRNTIRRLCNYPRQFKQKKSYLNIIGHNFSQSKAQHHLSIKQIIQKQTNPSTTYIQPKEAAQNLTDQINKMISFLKNNPNILQQYYSDTKLNAQQIAENLQEIKLNINDFANSILHFPENQILERKNFLQTIRTYIINHSTNSLLQSDRFDRLAYIVLIAINIKNVFIYFTDFGTPPNLLEKDIQFYNKIELLDYKNHHLLQEQHNNVLKVMNYFGGMAADTSDHSKISFGNARTIWSICIGISNYKKTLLKCQQMHFKGDFANMIRQIEFADQKAIKPILNKILPKITSHIMIYIPLNQNLEQNWNIFKQQQYSIPVRVLYYDKLPVFTQNNQTQSKFLKENIMFHIHGGAFVSNSSYSSQSYTRLWANQTKMIIFSIDYGLAPKHPFPRAVEDCQKVYGFMMRKGFQILKIAPKKIYIGGDSAGGNLTCSLTALILKKNLQRPSGLFLVYPLLDARRLFYGSRARFVSDPLLWPSIAVQAIQSYLPQGHEQQDPLASPILLTEGYINGNKNDQRFPQNWPTTYIHVGSSDPLRDESLMFMGRMIEAKIPCKCTLAAGLKHGYLLTDSVVTSSKQVVGHSAKMLVQLMEFTTNESQSAK